MPMYKNRTFYKKDRDREKGFKEVIKDKIDSRGTIWKGKRGIHARETIKIMMSFMKRRLK